MTCKPLMRDRLLSLLRAQYVTPIDALNQAGCMSLSQRAGEYSREGMVILKQKVNLPNGKWCMSYKLVK